jgi:hypothetical protein
MIGAAEGNIAEGINVDQKHSIIESILFETEMNLPALYPLKFTANLWIL